MSLTVSMTHWIIEKCQELTDVGSFRISESVRAYAHLILCPQASARSRSIGHTASALTGQKTFLNNFEIVVNHRVDIQEDIKHYQDNLSYALNEVDHSMGETFTCCPVT